MKSFALPSFWKCYRELPEHIQKLADKNFALFSDNPATRPSALSAKAKCTRRKSGGTTAPSQESETKITIGFGSARTKSTTTFGCERLRWDPLLCRSLQRNLQEKAPIEAPKSFLSGSYGAGKSALPPKWLQTFLETEFKVEKEELWNLLIEEITKRRKNKDD